MHWVGCAFRNVSYMIKLLLENLFKECSIQMSAIPGDNQSVVLLPFALIMEQSQDMTLFSITDHMLVSVNQPRKGIKMTIKMKRKIMSEMMTTYFPSLLLMIITYATTFFKPIFFEAALSVNLTTMLVMTRP